MKIVLFLTQVVCLVVQVFCLISIERDNKEIDSLLKKSGLKSVKVKRPKTKFYLCQWLALHCRKPIVIVYGRRGSGKTFTVFQYLKSLVKNPKIRKIVILYKTSVTARIMYDKILSMIEHYKIPNAAILRSWIKSGDIRLLPLDYLENDIILKYSVPDILIADECDDPLKLIMQNDFLANHYPNWKVNKLFITATPTTNIDKKMLYETIGKDRVKIYRWGLHCGPRVPRKLLKEMKRGVSNV